MKYRFERVIKSYITVEAPSLALATAIALEREPDDIFVDSLEVVDEIQI